MSRRVMSVRIKGFPLDEETKRLHEEIHRTAPLDEDIRREGLAIKAECEARQREFADVMSVLKAAREASGLSLRDVEERTGINKSNLSLLENGKGNPTLETVRRIAEAIGRRILITVE